MASKQQIESSMEAESPMIIYQCMKCSTIFTDANKPYNLGCKSQHMICQPCYSQVKAAGLPYFQCEWCTQLIPKDTPKVNNIILDLGNRINMKNQAATSKLNGQILSLKNIARQYRQKINIAEAHAKATAQKREKDLSKLNQDLETMKKKEIQKNQKLSQAISSYNKQKEDCCKLKIQLAAQKQEGQRWKQKLQEVNKELQKNKDLNCEMKSLLARCNFLEEKLSQQEKANKYLQDEIEMQKLSAAKYKNICAQEEMKQIFQACQKLCVSLIKTKFEKVGLVDHEDNSHKSESDRKTDEIEVAVDTSPQMTEPKPEQTNRLQTQDKTEEAKEGPIVQAQQRATVNQLHQQECKTQLKSCQTNQNQQKKQQKVALAKDYQPQEPESLLDSSHQQQSHTKSQQISKEASSPPSPNRNDASNEALNLSLQQKDKNQGQHKGNNPTRHINKETFKQNTACKPKDNVRGYESQAERSFNNSIQGSIISNCNSQVYRPNEEEYFDEYYDEQEDDQAYQQYQQGEEIFSPNPQYNQYMVQQNYRQYQQQQQQQNFHASRPQYNQQQQQCSQQYTHFNPQYSQQQYNPKVIMPQQYLQQQVAQSSQYQQKSQKPISPQFPSGQHQQVVKQMIRPQIFDNRGPQYGGQRFWAYLQDEQQRNPSFPARSIQDFRNNKTFRDEVMRDSIVQQLKEMDRTHRNSDEQLFVIANLEKKKQHAASKLELINKIKRQGSQGYYNLYRKIMCVTLSTIKEISLPNCQIEKIIDLREISTLQILNLSLNKIKVIEGFDNNTHLRDLCLNNNVIEKIENMAKLRQIHNISLHNNKLKKDGAQVIKRSNYDKLQVLSIQFNCSTVEQNYHCLSVILSKHWSNMRYIYWRAVANEGSQYYLSLVEQYNRLNRKPADKSLSIFL